MESTTTKISIKCSECGAKYNVPENYASRKIQCRKCGKLIFIKGEEPTTRRSTAQRPIPTASSSPKASGSKLALILPLVALVASLVVIVVVLKMFLLK